MSELVKVSIDEGIATFILNRPKAANSLSLELVKEFSEGLMMCRRNQEIRCIVLTGAGDRVFCAGADLKERASMNDQQVQETVATIGEAVSLVEKIPQPTIAAINGTALGGGMELILACDIRIASEHALFGLPETSLGIIPGAGGTQRLPRLIGSGRAKELIYTGKKITAHEAREYGLVEYVTHQNQVLEKAYEMASSISRNAPIAIRQAKRVINCGVEVALEDGLELEKEAYHYTIPTDDRKEGLLAFKEKRKPVYKGK
ncbi:enoyl-CoA hydratase [Metabacillus sp. HB246100]|uniref:enoyl-CoA hydratase n=1 Tax=Bacillus weihaiensis TaxID=1547283 RepID=UPI00235313C5|nr:enoyl-CoA hydratase [Bacillus weihaiensis]